MSIVLRTHKLLWGLSGGKCAFEECRADLVAAVDEDAHSVVGQEAHIVSREDGGPRADLAMPLDERDSYSNLVLLCAKHHKIIDDHPDKFPLVFLHDLKRKHETWVKSQGTFDKKKQKDDLFYADVIDRWEREAEIEHWEAWTSYWLAASGPESRVRKVKDLGELLRWLFGLDLPRRYGTLNRALRNFVFVLADLLKVFGEHSDPDDESDDARVRTEKFYKQDGYDEAQYQAALARYKEHVDLVWSLIFELTCAGNWVISRTQKALSPEFRRMEGVLIVHNGDLYRSRILKLKYRASELVNEHPYPGLDAFKKMKKTRIYGPYVGPFKDED